MKRCILMVVAVVTASSFVGHAQQPTAASCQANAQTPRAFQAIRYARQLNTYQSRAVSRDGRYGTLADVGIEAAPAGFTVQLLRDVDTYSFSVRDTADPCRFTVFSDQNGVIYTGVPIG